MRTIAALLLTAAVLAGCSEPREMDSLAESPETVGSASDPRVDAPPEDAFAAAFAGPIEESHGAEAWRRQEAVAADVVLEFGGDRVFEGRLLFPPDMSASRLELAGGTVAVWDGEAAWVSPASAELPRARFHLLTWPYFLALPFKLRDPGTRLEDLGERPLSGTAYQAARLTFEPGTGDTPDDWYVLYRDPASERLIAAAYIVTYGTPAEQAEAEPHAITYEDFQEVEGVQVPTTWRFWSWNEEEGVDGEPIGRVALENVRFGPAPAGAFERPEDAREDALPAARP
ncbi:MAG TPA: hypothetical protein VHQ65_08175, partial [Thermoanaerobaculia bacterium]|nr:hypothetical protein [Thermoanaerobaculia bacterium]